MTVSAVQAQRKKIEPIDTIRVPLYNGFMVQVDMASAITSVLPSAVKYSYEASLQVDLKHKFYPIVELGFAGANKNSIDNANFTTNAPFGRIGIDFNLSKKKKDSKPTNNLFLLGVRLGMSNFKYKLTNVTISNDYWGGTEIVDYSNIPATTKIWWELVAGVHVEVVKNIYMGWGIRKKSLLSQDVVGNVAPWFIPGFGINITNNWSLNYTVGYHF